MKSKIEGAPAFAYVNVDLEPGESIIAESNAMSSMSGDLDMDAKTNGGCLSALGKSMFMNSGGNLVVSDDPDHLIATIGCNDLVIINTGKTTLVCPKDAAESIKELHMRVAEELGEDYL